MPAVSIRGLEITGNYLIASTYGRSKWKLADISVLRQITPAMSTAPVVLFRPSSGYIDYYLRDAASGEVKLEILDAAGHVIRSLAGDSKAGAHRADWNLHMDPPPSVTNRYRRLASALMQDPQSPDGPRVLPGTYR